MRRRLLSLLELLLVRRRPLRLCMCSLRQASHDGVVRYLAEQVSELGRPALRQRTCDVRAGFVDNEESAPVVGHGLGGVERQQD